MLTQSERERRTALRRRIDWPLLVTRTTGELLACHAVDVSEEGLRLRSAHAFAPGSFLRLRLQIPGRGECILRSRVCYQVLESDSILTGVRFEQVPPQWGDWLRMAQRR
ncbi:PilZ domain-containing protein [Uliginosibacterium aquaticum]|uniref:PilZ domain-containing protein n=1 Tax=Uliginosibacterium aquaticum TaxID=2731212 RepID=A0ABX2IKZ3_9RHOO|nr:PilZ domain-containing protein [Uliginosibacterium aquaticum]NSL55001.1 PilZ domain-containing protein [Uliginosibacterium aquaticum]